MATLSCNCFNVSLLLQSTPVPTSDYAWLAAQLGTKRLGDAKFRNNGVPVIELESLVSTRSVSGWKVWKCWNCNADVCAIDSSDPTRGFVNMELEEHSGHQNGAHKLSKGDPRFFSPCFRVILEENTDISDRGGVGTDAQAVQAFNKLQGRVDSFIGAEEALMEKRIKEFIKKQQEEFNLVRTRANKDRAIVWRTMCKLNKSYASAERSAPDSSLSTTSTSKVAASAPSKIAPITSRTDAAQDVSTAPKTPQRTPDKGWQAADVSKVATSNFKALKVSTSDGIFNFDDEDTGAVEDGASYRLPSRYFDESSDGEDEGEDTYIDPAKYLGASLPIHIVGPSLSNRIRESKAIHVTFNDQDPDERPQKQRQTPRESWSSRSAIGEDVPAEMAASFTVPLSLNRRIKSLI